MHYYLARELIRVGRANKHWIDLIFAINMTDRTLAKSEFNGIDLNIDTGSKNTGIAIVVNADNMRHTLALVQIKHRAKQISNNLTKRSNCRRTRRGRLRYRAPRFNNRGIPKGWLAPFVRSIPNNIHRWINLLYKIYPITCINIESNKFDMQKMVNPNIDGIEYQQGTLHGWQIKNYILYKCNRTCVYCDKKKDRMEIDHIVPQSKEGSNRIDNLI